MITLAHGPQEIFAIHPEFRLRNDRKYIVAANLDADRGLNGVMRLAPIEGVLVSLFDGKRTVKEVADISTAFFPETASDAERQATILVEKILETYTEPQSQLPVPLLIREKEIPQEKNTIFSNAIQKNLLSGLMHIDLAI